MKKRFGESQCWDADKVVVWSANSEFELTNTLGRVPTASLKKPRPWTECLQQI
ncbi:hypothetical protein ACI6PS_15630 [Flavobacterium sp. PLA-1-15]|uniref:hypothetical protein n=1 Tax=Flavobacterium sp. PLA-1-15 TaxID=3380533 RepID=UPI003B7CA627